MTWYSCEPTLAVSVNLVEAEGPVPTINLGVEAWALVPLAGTRLHSHLLMGGGVVVGPTLSASRGRLWVTAHLGIPVEAPDATIDSKAFDFDRLRLGLRLPLVGRVMLGINL